MNKPRRFRTKDADDMSGYMNHEVVRINERARRNMTAEEEKRQ